MIIRRIAAVEVWLGELGIGHPASFAPSGNMLNALGQLRLSADKLWMIVSSMVRPY